MNWWGPWNLFLRVKDVNGLLLRISFRWSDSVFLYAQALTGAVVHFLFFIFSPLCDSEPEHINIYKYKAKSLIVEITDSSLFSTF